MNTIKTTFLLGLMTGLILLCGQAIGGRQGLVIAFVLAAVMNLGSYWFSHKIVLAQHRAREADPGRYPVLHRVAERLVAGTELPKPALYVVPSPIPNAFATGRNPAHAVVAVTEGLLDSLDEDELEGVVAHELAHVRNRDILISSIAATIAGAIMVLASIARWSALFGGFGGRDRDSGNIIGVLAMAILAPIAAVIIQMAISRTREFKADATGAELAGRPDGLIRALRKIESANQRVPSQASPATAHMYIANPLSGGIGKLLSTHPPMEERIERLQRRG